MIINTFQKGHRDKNLKRLSPLNGHQQINKNVFKKLVYNFEGKLNRFKMKMFTENNEIIEWNKQLKDFTSDFLQKSFYIVEFLL